jgi:hypothetical protein
MPSRPHTLRRVASLFAAVAALAAAGLSAGVVQPDRPAVVLVTLDGARTEEIFGGLDAEVYASTLSEKQTLQDQRAYRQFWAETPAARREKLMPFFWGTLMREHGSIAGNRRLGSAVTLTNTHRFSYPGYSEILLGEAHDDTIKSNDPVRNPYSTVLEEVQSALKLSRTQVAVFGSWDVFNAIVEHREGALTVNSGYEPFDSPDPLIKALSGLQNETPTGWNSVRHDAYTFRIAMDHFRRARPRVVYLALGETDDWAHDGRYDRVLETYARTDAYLRELWTWLQSDPEYRGRTHVLITTDHGRGHTTKDWRTHGAKVEGAQDVWIAIASPSMTRRGEWREHQPLHTNQVAATLAAWMGLDWRALRPSAGLPIRAN